MASGGLGGGLAGGLLEGVKAGAAIKGQGALNDLYRKKTELLGSEGERAAQEFEFKNAERDKKASGLDDFFQEANKVLTFRTDGSGQPMAGAAQQQPVMMDPGFKRMPGFARGGLISLKPRGFAEGGMIPDAVFSGNSASALSAPGLATVQRPPVAQQESPQANVNPRQEFTRQMVSSDLLANPDKLSKLSALADAHGVGDMIKPFLERAYTAKKSGMIDGAMQLMRGQVDEAIDSLARGGIKLEDRPTPVDPKNPKLWKINISGVGEREMDIGDLLQTTLDPDKFLKYQLDQNESQGKRNVSDSAVRENDAKVGVHKAQAGKLGEETKNIKLERSPGGLGAGGISKLPAPAATAEWLVQNGVHDNYKDAFNAVKTLNDKSPSAARASLIEAAMKNGSTIGEAAKEVDDFLAQSGQAAGNSGGVQAPAPSGGVRKYNPKTGGFD